MAPDCVSHGPGVPPAIGTDAIKGQAALLRAAIPDLHAKLMRQAAEGDLVASHWIGTGTHTGAASIRGQNVAPTGRSIAFEEMRIDRFVDGRIVEAWFIPDRFTLWQQLGLLPSPTT